MITIHPIPALKDNYIWTIIDDTSKKAIVVDPGEAAPVIDFIAKNDLKLQYILLTHHHWDHTNGAVNLCDRYNAKIYGPGLKKSDSIALENYPLSFKIIEIPGHTLDHTGYYSNQGHLFSGDTLFSAGCGRVFEGTMEQMYKSLQKLANLPDETKLYCGHEYTENNLSFAQTVEPNNSEVKQKLTEVRQLRIHNKVTLPSTIAQEKATNPFLRCEVPAIVAAAGKFAGEKLSNPVEVFTALRQWKDEF